MCHGRSWYFASLKVAGERSSDSTPHFLLDPADKQGFLLEKPSTLQRPNTTANRRASVSVIRKVQIRGMRVSVELILSLLAQGEDWDSILKDYPDHPDLEADDIRACLAYAHAVIANDTLDEIQVKRT